MRFTVCLVFLLGGTPAGFTSDVEPGGRRRRATCVCGAGHCGPAGFAPDAAPGGRRHGPVSLPVPTNSQCELVRPAGFAPDAAPGGRRHGPVSLPVPTNSQCELVRPAGFEPATLGLEGRCSIHLSYGRTPIDRSRSRPRPGLTAWCSRCVGTAGGPVRPSRDWSQAAVVEARSGSPRCHAWSGHARVRASPAWPAIGRRSTRAADVSWLSISGNPRAFSSTARRDLERRACGHACRGAPPCAALASGGTPLPREAMTHRRRTASPAQLRALLSLTGRSTRCGQWRGTCSANAIRL